MWCPPQTYHGNFILGGRSTRGVEVQTLLHLLLKNLTKLGGWLLGEVVNSRSNRALVREESRDSALVLGPGFANE